MNPLSQLGILRTALSFTGNAASAAGAATGDLVNGVSQSFHDIFSQGAESPGEEQVAAAAAATPGRLQKAQADLLAAVRGALARAGIGADQVTPLELTIGVDHQGRDVVSVTDGHPQRATLEMILQADQDVTDAAYRLIDLHRSDSAPGEPVRISLRAGVGGTLA